MDDRLSNSQVAIASGQVRTYIFVDSCTTLGICDAQHALDNGLLGGEGS